MLISRPLSTRGFSNVSLSYDRFCAPGLDAAEGLLADALEMLLSTQPDMRCIGTVSDGEQALAQSLALHPDVLLLDLGLPRLDGLSVVAALQGAALTVKVLVVTARLDPLSIRTALSLGAAGYLPKDENSDELLLAIRSVAQGRRYISEVTARKHRENIRRKLGVRNSAEMAA
jgi:DNA-binding NarL/FixJ family response regulator